MLRLRDLGVVGLIACKGEPPGIEPADASCQPNAGDICTVIGTGERGANGDDLPPLETHLFLPTASAFDPDGTLVVVDFNNLRVRRNDDDGVLRTVAGVGMHSYASDGIEATDSALENPIDIAIAPDGTLFVVELHGARVLSVDPSGWLTVYAGSPDNPGYECYTGDGGPAREACLSQMVGVALGDDGTLYLADTNNHCIRRVDAEGVIDTVAGSGAPGWVDGTGTEAAFNLPNALAYLNGSLYVADRANHRIRKVDVVTGEVVTVAGNGTPAHAGDGGPATDASLSLPVGIEAAPDGTLFIADADNHVVRRVEPDGTISTIAGQPGEFGPGGDGGPASEASLSWPNDVTLSPDGDLVVTDTMNDRVRTIYGVW